MRFHRSLSSSRCPPAVLERAKGKRHNRQLIGELFESWLSAGEDWMQSSVVANATRSMAQRKRGKYVMMEFRALKTRFGGPLAKQILTEKKQQQENKDANDPLTYWMKHPDVASEDFEMVRIFDSMVYEDEVQDDLTLGICASGNLDASQTRQAMQIAVGGEIEKLQSMGLGMQPGGGGNSVPAAPTEKPKKVTPISKQVTNKISSSSAKLTELMAWESKIKDNTVLSPTLLAGFATELGARKDAITSAKTTLESSYAKTLGKTDAQIQEDKELLETITTSLANVEAAFTSFNGTIKSIKLAIDPPPKKEPKAKAKAKADAAPPA
ncbi:unnamed protein product [Cladocopium goreaui]|uniref:Uncharacterized protein n=1 Tax=Cladocopium goreaui TaxID=2562237 RepID=A0A9P1FU18_9DINO|nr:unnamed protein product [Cladocopium goreaui]